MSEMMQNHSPDWRSERAKNHRRLRPKRGFLADTIYHAMGITAPPRNVRKTVV